MNTLVNLEVHIVVEDSDRETLISAAEKLTASSVGGIVCKVQNSIWIFLDHQLSWVLGRSVPKVTDGINKALQPLGHEFTLFTYTWEKVYLPAPIEAGFPIPIGVQMLGQYSRVEIKGTLTIQDVAAYLNVYIQSLFSKV